jgi:hypothetical protein
MTFRRRAVTLLCTALAVPLAVSPAGADPSTPLTGFGDFGAGASQVVLDDLGLVHGDPLAAAGGVSFSVGSVPATYFEDFFVRESGLDLNFGASANFVGVEWPYPSLTLSFATPIHKVGFEARVNPEDQLSLTLLRNGVTVDTVVVASRGSDALYFYGVQNAAAFDQVVVDAVEGASGAFTLDNVTFETLVVEDPTDPTDPTDPADPLALSCQGFEVFPSGPLSKLVPARALLAQLVKEDGTPLTSLELATPPTVRVMFAPDNGAPSQDVTASVVWQGANFAYAGGRLQRWFLWLLPLRMQGYGTYMAEMVSGDAAAYTLTPTCVDWTVNVRPKPKPVPPKPAPRPHDDRDCRDRSHDHRHDHDRDRDRDRDRRGH